MVITKKRPGLKLILIIHLILIEFICSSCAPKSKRRQVDDQGQDRLKGSAPTIPLISFEPETPWQQREKKCKNYKGALKSTCMNDTLGLEKYLYYASEEESVNMPNKLGWTALMWAAKNGQAQNLKLLLEHPSIDLSLTDKTGLNALIYAASVSGRDQMTEKILAHPEAKYLNLNHQDIWKDSALMLNIKNQNKLAFAALLKRKAKVNDQVSLVEVVKMEQLEFLHLLRDYNVDVNAPNRQGQLAIVEAALNKSTDLMAFLIDAMKANYNKVDKHHKMTAVMLAASVGKYKMVKYLSIRKDLNLSYRHPQSKWSALDYAQNQGHKQIAELLKSLGAP